MAKPVCGICNLECSYCYYIDKPETLYPGTRRFFMSDRVLRAYVAQFMDMAGPRAEFAWQGGEPLLAGKAFFQKVVGLQKQYAPSGQVVVNALQTNGTLLDDEWCRFLADHHFLVGLSVDGPATWHDAYRKDRHGAPTFLAVWNALGMLRRYGVEFNVLATLNSLNASDGAEPYRYLTRRGVRYVQFIPILERDADGKVMEFSCRPQQYERFLLELLDLWIRRDVGRVSERLIDNVMVQLLFGRASCCCHARRCADSLVLEWNGDLYVCDHFVYERWKLGNILDIPLRELLCSPLLDEFGALKTDLPSQCRGCDVVDFCMGGCPKHHVPLYGGAERVNYFCSAYKAFFSRAIPRLLPLVRRLRPGQALSSMALKFRPGAPGLRYPVASGFTADSPAPGRNDPCPCGSGLKFKRCCGAES